MRPVVSTEHEHSLFSINRISQPETDAQFHAIFCEVGASVLSLYPIWSLWSLEAGLIIIWVTLSDMFEWWASSKLFYISVAVVVSDVLIRYRWSINTFKPLRKAFCLWKCTKKKEIWKFYKDFEWNETMTLTNCLRWIWVL